jgi:hypothetical protein
MSMKVSNGLDMQNTFIANLPTPTDPAHAVSKSYVDTIFGGWAWKDAARVASTGNINLAAPGATIDGVTLANGDRVLVKDQTTGSQNGIYIFNGAASPMTRSSDADAAAEFEAAKIGVEEGTTNAGTQWKQTVVNLTLDTTTIIWQSDDAAVPTATETVAGKAELATQVETDTGSDDTRIVTPLKLANWPGRTRKVSANFGDNSATQFDFTHNFNTRAVQVEIFRNASPWDTILCDVSRPDANTVRVNFAVAPTSNQFTYVIWA